MLSVVRQLMLSMPLLRGGRRLLNAGLLSVLALLPFYGIGVALAIPQDDYQPYSAATSSSGPSEMLFVLIAYFAIWFIVLLFVISIWRRQLRVESELEQLQRQLKETVLR
jgi:CcmD family protein